MFIPQVITQLEPLAEESRKRKIPILKKDKAIWLLEQVQILKPKRILELGTANGYSGSILGSKGAELITIEINSKIAEEASITFSKNKINVNIIIGDATKLTKELSNTNQKFDLIFIDHAKKQYLPILKSCIKLLNKQGTIIADNITFEKCQDFKEAILNHTSLDSEIINIGDGLSISKLK